MALSPLHLGTVAAAAASGAISFLPMMRVPLPPWVPLLARCLAAADVAVHVVAADVAATAAGGGGAAARWPQHDDRVGRRIHPSGRAAGGRNLRVRCAYIEG